MSSQFQPWQSSEGLPVELIEMIVEKLPTPTALLNFACTSSLINSIVFRKPSRLYVLDARYHNLSIDASRYTAWRPVTLPSLIYAIQNDSLDKIKSLVEIFQAETCTLLNEPWALYNFPLPTEAAIRAGRLDALTLLINSGCWLGVRDISGQIYGTFMEYMSYSCSTQVRDLMTSFLLRPLGVQCTENDNSAFVLACLEGQEDIALWLLDNIYVSQRYYLYVAIQTGLKGLLKRFTLDDLSPQDPLIPSALKLAISTDSTSTDSIDWASNYVTRLRARRGSINQEFFDDLIEIMVAKGLWEIAATSLDLILDGRLVALQRVAKLAAATDDGLPVTSKFIASLCRHGHFDRWSNLETPSTSNDSNLDQLEMLLVEASRESAPKTFRWIMSMRGKYAMMQLTSIIDSNKSIELSALLPWNAFKLFQGCCGTPGCFSMHQSLEKGSELLSRALSSESWDCAFLLIQGGANLYKINQDVKNFLRRRLATLEYPKGKPFATHLASTLREPNSASTAVSETQELDLFLEKLTALFRLFLSDKEILECLAEMGNLQ
ncbi:hypothetical protein GGR51DRAFT_557132 [Nemania sp. FL0031]|nr:hypothetical protein GGR51DRAFT_557132 [Nemania sp. FL0031]